MFSRLLGCSYLALSFGYWSALKASFIGERQIGTIWVGIISNGAASVCLLCYGLTGHWATWGVVAQTVLWFSTLATFLITLGLYIFGVRES